MVVIYKCNFLILMVVLFVGSVILVAYSQKVQERKEVMCDLFICLTR